MLAVFKQTVAAGDTYISPHVYIGDTNSAAPLMTIPIQSVFIKGATSTVTVSLEAAFIFTPVDQSVQPVDADYVNVQTYTTDGVTNGASLNGLWVRFKIVNGSGTSAIVTSALTD